MTGIERFRKQLIGETQATARSLESLASVPESARSSEAYQRGLGVMAHIQQARRVWLERVERRPVTPVADWFPAWAIEESARHAAELDRSWSTLLDSIREPDLERPVVYASFKGERFSSTLDDILIHVFNHSTYHRGQVARLVSECGGDRALTDYIGFFRTPLD